MTRAVDDQERDALLTRIAEALGIAPKLAALVDESTIVDEAARVRRERDAARAELARLDGKW